MGKKDRRFLGIALLASTAVVAVLFLLITKIVQDVPPSLASSDTNGGKPGLHISLPQPTSSTTNTGNGTAPGSTAVTTVISTGGSHQIQLALSQDVLTSLFVSQFGAQQSTITDLKVVPTSNSEIILTLNLQIATNGFQRTMPIELDSIIGLDTQQNIWLHVQHLKRDGRDAGLTATGNMQTAVNQLLTTLLMPAVHNLLKGIKLVSIQTSLGLCCGVNTEMLVLVLQLA